jgi:hypothetical protein
MCSLSVLISSKTACASFTSVSFNQPAQQDLSKLLKKLYTYPLTLKRKEAEDG